MMSIQQFQKIVADALFQGDMMLAGLTIFGIIMGVVLAMCKNDLKTGFILMLPITLFGTLVGLLTGEITVLLIIVDVLMIAMIMKTGMATG